MTEANATLANYFISDYRMARKFFRESTKNSECEKFEVPSQLGTDLTVDTAYYHGNESLWVMVSGIHGLEAPAGSAVQRMFIDHFLPLLIKKNIGVLLVHSMNPFGWEYSRRCTENNINLNRNFVIDHKIFNFVNKSYQQYVQSALVEEKLNSIFSSWLKTLKLVSKGLIFNKLTSNELTRAIAEGQYHHSTGIEYGGQKLEPQAEYLLELLKRNFKKYKNIIFFDLHTGLGDRGEIILIPPDNQKAFNPDLKNKLLNDNADSEIYRLTSVTSPGNYPTIGDLPDAVASLLADRQNGIALTVEFGTVGNSIPAKLNQLQTMLAENQGYNFGYINKKLESIIKKNCIEQSIPSEKKWRETVMKKSYSMFSQFITRI